MMCLFCGTLQPIQQNCANVDCGKQMACYYCDICKFLDDAADKSIYHCHECGLCRVGKVDEYFHCPKCNLCLQNSLRNHKCIENNTKANCPICTKDLFTSTVHSSILRCGHAMHYKCYDSYLQQGEFTCPICLKSVMDLTDAWIAQDQVMEEQQMPPEFANSRTQILCNDCEKKCETSYHFMGHKCSNCGSYNTQILSTSGLPDAQTLRQHIQSLSTQQPAEIELNDESDDEVEVE